MNYSERAAERLGVTGALLRRGLRQAAEVMSAGATDLKQQPGRNQTIASRGVGAGLEANGNSSSSETIGERLASAALALVSGPFGEAYVESGGADLAAPAATAMTQTSGAGQPQAQQSFYDWWQEYWSRQPFPSGYTQSSITLLACLITTIIFLIVVGNCLVCIAIFTEKSLKPTQNWFIASLAVSDMLLGLVVMPFSLARELMGFWVFGPLWCDIHEAVDVLLTTASINTLCLISLDRYWSITQAVSYLKKRTPRRGAFMIAFVWVFSAAVSLPPLFGWKKQSPSASSAPPPSAVNTSKPALAAAPAAADQDLDSSDSRRQGAQDYDEAGATPATQRENWRRKRRRQATTFERPPASELDQLLLARDQRDQQAFYANLLMQQQSMQTTPAPMLVGSTEYPVCQLSDDIGYVLYSAFGSFFIPCGVMVFTYIRIFLAARSRARRAINKQSRNATAASDKAKQRAASASQQQLQRRTISGQTGGGRASKQLGNAASTALLVEAADLGADEEAPAGGQKRRADSLAKQQQQQVIANERAEERATSQRKQSVVRGSKLVVVERRKSTVQQLEPETCATLTTSGAQQATASALQPTDNNRDQQQQQQSSLITVMSESMAELPVTRFEFKQPDSSKAAGESAAKSGSDHNVAALLKAISHASDIVEENQLKEILEESGSCDLARKQQPEQPSEPTRQQQQQQESNVISDAEATGASVQNNSTNETCFMTIEEDSDNLEAQTGRTIMMVAGNARSPLPNAAKAQGITMTMLPPARTLTEGASESNSSPVICNNVACLRRQRRNDARATSSYCGSSMTINDDDEDEEEEEEDVADEEEEEEEDECLEDDLLTDDCNGYSNSCALDPECGLHCRECAALASKAAQDSCHDSPGCQLSTPGDSPRIFAHTHKHHQQSATTIDSSTQEQPLVVCNHQHHGATIGNSAKRNHQHHRHQSGSQQLHNSEQNESLTGEDNLSFTDYRSQDDNSSVVGHDVLDATPAPERSHTGDKRRSIVAAAFASVAGRTHQDQEEESGLRGSKKSSIGFRLSRLGSSAPPLSRQTGGLLALADAESQQQQLVAASPNNPATVTRNLRSLRENFFQKLNQLTAKSAMRQQKLAKSRSPNGKSSAQSSYGSSYEPSIDYATTSNMPSNNEQYHQETTFAETDDYEPQTSGETKESSGGGGGVEATEYKQRQLQINMSQTAGSKMQPLARPGSKQKSEHSFSAGQADNLSESMATNRLLPSTTTDDDSMLMQSASNSGAAINKSSNTLDLNSNKTNFSASNNKADANQLNRHMSSGYNHGVAIGKSTPASGAKKRSTDKGQTLAGQGEQQLTHHNHHHLADKPDKQMGSSARSAGTISTRAYLASDNERHKRKLAKARERRATLILGLIMAAFICSWMPFFTFYVLRAICHVCRDYISPRFEAFIFWMGYCNSAINPIIYTIFNRDFRKAFRKILFRCL